MKLETPNTTEGDVQPDKLPNKNEGLPPIHDAASAGDLSQGDDAIARQAAVDQARIAQLSEFFQQPERETVTELNPQERDRIQEVFKRLKNVIETQKISPEARTFLLTTEITTVIAGVRPAAYVQPKLFRKSWKIWEKKSGLSENDLENITTTLQELGVSIIRDKQNEDEINKQNSRGDQSALLHIQRNDLALERMQSSGMFSDEELDLFQKDPLNFYRTALSGRKAGYASAYRIGVLLGYPLTDVAAAVELQKLKEKKGELDVEEQKQLQSLEGSFHSAKTVRGLSGTEIGWKTLDPQGDEVKSFQNRVEISMQIAQDVFREK